MKDEDVSLTIERAGKGIKRANQYWRAGGPKTLALFELRVAIKRLIRVWWHMRRSKALTDKH